MTSVPSPRMVYVRVRSDLKLIDAMGVEVKTRAPFTAVERWLCVTARLVRSTYWLNLVRFRDGTECWVFKEDCRFVDDFSSCA